MAGTKGILIISALVVAVVAAYIFMFYLPKVDEVAELQQRLDSKREDMLEKQQITKDKDRFDRQIEELNERLKESLEQLPNKREIADILKMFSELARISGIQLTSFAVRPEVVRDLFSEVPVDLQFQGGFHNVAIFFDKISQQSRIINITNVKIGNPNLVNGETIVNTTCTATAFRFVKGAVQGKKSKKKKT